MNNLKQLQKFIFNLEEWSGYSCMSINILGYSEEDSEIREFQISIELQELKSNDKIICPHIFIRGHIHEDIDDVAKKVLIELKKQNFINE